jgi:AraC family transcriptional regulator of adaptative response/methylated-DNA-[protein]-cysteine methyltransferase
MLKDLSKNPYYQAQIETPLGPMLAISDEKSLCLLEFTDRRGLVRELERLHLTIKAPLVSGKPTPIHSIEKELNAYFEGTSQDFKTPIQLMGTPFQQEVWKVLMRVPYGETRSYGAQAESLGRPSAARAVANANGANQVAIVIPCHRIINTDGGLGGYAGGLHRKQWLIDHERRVLGG